MIGINFKLKNEFSDFLFRIFQGTGVDNFVWNIRNEEIIYKDKNNNFNTSIFQNSIVNGQEFFRCIQAKDYYLVFADIKAFKNELEITNIYTYDDFVNSDCEIALFCTDTIYIELYCKNKVILNNIINNCKNFGVYDIQILSERNNERKEFRI